MRTGGIRQRPQEVEYCPSADLFARWTRVARGGVSGRGEKKANAEFADGAPRFTQWQIDANAQSFQNVGGATFRADGAVAVLGDVCSRGSSDKRGCGRNIKCAGSVSTCAACVHHVRGRSAFRGKYWSSVAAHNAGKRPKFRETDPRDGSGPEASAQFPVFQCARKEVLPSKFRLRRGQRSPGARFLRLRNRRIHKVATDQTWPLNLARDAPLK